MKSNNIKEKLKFLLYFNILTILFLIWKFHPSNDVNVSCKYLERKYNQDRKQNINFNRMLAKAKVEKKVEQKGLNVKDSFHGMNKEMKNEKKDSSTYEKIKKEKKNDLDYYMKSYKDRYSKRIGLGKFDCYCENKLFRGIDKMNKLANTPNITKSKFKNEICKRYGLRIGLTYLFYFFALALGIVDLLNKNKVIGNKEFFNDELFGESFKNIGKHLIPSIGDLFVYVIPFLITLIIIYVLIKIVKYERLKSCKTKMSAMEYCGLCKDIF